MKEMSKSVVETINPVITVKANLQNCL